MDFTSYLKFAGLNEAEAEQTAQHITSWDELHNWLDNNAQEDTTPLVHRVSIGTPSMETSWKVALKRRFSRLQDEGQPVGEEPLWPAVVERRRRISLITTLFLTASLILLANSTLTAEHISSFLKTAYLCLYGIMSYFMISTFAKLAIGSWHAIRGPAGNPWHPAHTASEPRPEVKVAILYPVYHEDPARVVAGMLATAQSICRDAPEYKHHYEFFLLSDSREPGYRIAEMAALNQAQKACPDILFHYRWRVSNDHAKLGNIIDFCRRWGKAYEYMLVMDADSLMQGKTIHKLLRMMEGNHRLGILQTNPTPILRESFFGRMEQFAGRLYGTVFSYSLQAMYMGHASYIGHNAIIRTQAFIDHCMLPDLSGKKPWGGKPLSHDIIEAALMARAGYEVWFLPGLGGSYEEIPANILGFLIRERRWMQGNLQHIRFLFLKGLKTVHRENFLSGFMNYMSAPLWAIFLIISAVTMVSYMQSGHLSQSTLVQIEVPTIMMLAASVVFLFAPRILAICLHIKKEKAYLFGGKHKLLLSTLIETIFSFFFAPLMMAFLCRFIWLWAKRKSISWGTQRRDDEALPWSDCFKHFAWTTAIGIVATIALFYQIKKIPKQVIALMSVATGHLLTPESIFIWFFPILAGLAFSILIARVTSRTFPFLKKTKWFMIPEEVVVPTEITDMDFWNKRLIAYIPDPEKLNECVNYALLDQLFYIKQRARTRHKLRVSEAFLPKIQNHETLSVSEFMIALEDTSCLDALHQISCDHTA